MSLWEPTLVFVFVETSSTRKVNLNTFYSKNLEESGMHIL